jgi:hypothetical protein
MAELADRRLVWRRLIAKIVNMVSQLDGLTHATIDFVSLR